MNRIALSLTIAVTFLLLVLPTTSAHAQASRTWVSGVGDDANPCSRTAPCKTFAGAISKTAAGGIIDALDPAGFGAVTITKSIQIESVGNVASALAAGTNGIIINAGPNDTVSLRGLSINGIGTGLHGIRLLQAGKLIVADTNVDGFTQNGIDIEPTASAQVSLRNVTVTGSGNAGVWVYPTAGTTTVELDNVNLSHGKYGIYVVSGKASLKHSVVSANSSYGVCASSNGTLVRIGVDDSLVSDNAGVGIRSVGAQSSIYVSRTSVTGNATGLAPLLSGALVSYGNNRIFENTTNGPFSATLMEQ
jgi:hypothetical protein